MNNDLLKLQASLCDAINAWIDKENGGDGWEALDTYLGDNIGELMASSAFMVLLGQKNLTEYYRSQKMLKD